MIAAVGLAAVTIQSDLRTEAVAATTGAGPWPQGNAATPLRKLLTVQDTAALAQAAEGVLRSTDRLVNFTIGTPGLWPYVAGMVLELDERGVQSTVSPASWELYFGHERAPGRPPSVTFDLLASSDPPSVIAANGTVVADIHGSVLTYRRTAS